MQVTKAEQTSDAFDETTRAGTFPVVLVAVHHLVNQDSRNLILHALLVGLAMVNIQVNFFVVIVKLASSRESDAVHIVEMKRHRSDT